MKSFNLLNASTVITSLFLINLLGWILFFPETGSFETSNDKVGFGVEVVVFIAYFLVFYISSLAVKYVRLDQLLIFVDTTGNASDRYLYQYWYYVAIVSILLSTFSTIFRYQEFLSSLDNFDLFFESGGTHKILQEYVITGSGASLIQGFSPVGAIILSLILFFKKAHIFKSFSMFYLLCILNALSITLINSTRTAIVNFILIVAFSFFAANLHKRIGRYLIYFLLFVVISYWGGAYFRDAQIYMSQNNVDFFSIATQNYILSVFLEKYTVGEFNNTLLIFSQSVNEFNPFYFTLLSLFYPSILPDGYLNTLHSFGIWYWQFGFLPSIVFVMLFAVFLQLNFSAAMKSAAARQIDFSIVIYCLIWIGAFNFGRINYYMLSWFVFPVIYLLIAQSLKIFFVKK